MFTFARDKIEKYETNIYIFDNNAIISMPGCFGTS